MIKVVPDTSSLIRGFTSYINPQRQLINLAVAHKITLFGSSETYNEFARKIKIKRLKRFLEPKFLNSKLLLNNYSNLITLIEPEPNLSELSICRDPNDDIFIKVALSVGSPIIVSEDDDLLSIKRYKDVRIVNAETFIKVYGGN